MSLVKEWAASLSKGSSKRTCLRLWMGRKKLDSMPSMSTALLTFPNAKNSLEQKLSRKQGVAFPYRTFNPTLKVFWIILKSKRQIPQEERRELKIKMVICRNKSTGRHLLTSPIPPFLSQWPTYLWVVIHLLYTFVSVASKLFWCYTPQRKK